MPLAIGRFDTFDLYAAYTNRSFCQVYNSDQEFLGFTNTANSIGLVHQSNGRSGVLSRSWNRVYANFVVENGNLGLMFRPWCRIHEDLNDDDNNGYGESLIDYNQHTNRTDVGFALTDWL